MKRSQASTKSLNGDQSTQSNQTQMDDETTTAPTSSQSPQIPVTPECSSNSEETIQNDEALGAVGPPIPTDDNNSEYIQFQFEQMLLKANVYDAPVAINPADRSQEPDQKMEELLPEAALQDLEYQDRRSTFKRAVTSISLYTHISKLSTPTEQNYEMLPREPKLKLKKKSKITLIDMVACTTASVAASILPRIDIGKSAKAVVSATQYTMPVKFKKYSLQKALYLSLKVASAHYNKIVDDTLYDTVSGPEPSTSPTVSELPLDPPEGSSTETPWPLNIEYTCAEDIL